MQCRCCAVEQLQRGLHRYAVCCFAVCGTPHGQHTQHQHHQHRGCCVALLVICGRFQTVTEHFFDMGHTHRELVQRFTVVAATLSSASLPQTPAAFAARNEQHVGPQRGRLTTSVELDQGAWHWHLWLAAWVSPCLAGAPSVAELDVCNCWTLVSRAAFTEHVPPSVESQLVAPLEFKIDVTSPRRRRIVAEANGQCR